MAKKVVGKIKLQIQAGKANPSPPVGPALGQHGVNIMDFCKQFNARTESQAGYIIPVVIDVYEDRSFTFVTKSPPAPVLIKKALNLPKGSAVPNKTKVGEITQAQLEEIAKIKMNDLNATSMEAAVKMIKGSCRAMGVTVKEEAQAVFSVLKSTDRALVRGNISQFLSLKRKEGLITTMEGL